MNEILTMFNATTVLLIIKFITVIILFFFILFTVVLFIQVRALNRSVSMHAFFATKFITISAVIYILASISLFIAAIVIL
jgi:hypothetical protein